MSHTYIQTAYTQHTTYRQQTGTDTQTPQTLHTHMHTHTLHMYHKHTHRYMTHIPHIQTHHTHTHHNTPHTTHTSHSLSCYMDFGINNQSKSFLISEPEKPPKNFRISVMEDSKNLKIEWQPFDCFESLGYVTHYLIHYCTADVTGECKGE